MPLDIVKLESLMLTAKVSQSELARRIGVKQSVVNRMLRDPGETVLLSTAERMADAVGVPLSSIISPVRPGAVIV